MLGFTLQVQSFCSSRSRLPVVRPRRVRTWRGVTMAASEESSSEDEKPVTFPKLKDFLEGTKKLGKMRIIAQNDASVMEAISTSEKLFYATIPNGIEYANIIDMSINLDLHLKMPAVGGARFENGVSRGPSKAPTYIIRVLGEDLEKTVLSLFLQWDKNPEDLEEERITAWKELKEKFVEENDMVRF